jgi:hypothetical protein
VTTAPEPEPELPWQQPTTELPAQPASRRRIIVLLLPVVGLLVLCCGGAALTMSVFHGDKPKAAGPTMVIPSSPSAPAPTTAPPSPTPSASPSASPTSRKPTTHPTTHRPRPTTARPTTTKPKPAPSTPGGIQQNVRVNGFCSPRGALGISRRGEVLRCGPSVDDPRNRWRPMI